MMEWLEANVDPDNIARALLVAIVVIVWGIVFKRAWDKDKRKRKK